MLIALPVLPLDASTMVSPGLRRPSRSARSIMYLAILAFTEPDGLRYSSFAQMPSTRISGVLPIPSRTVRAGWWAPGCVNGRLPVEQEAGLVPDDLRSVTRIDQQVIARAGFDRRAVVQDVSNPARDDVLAMVEWAAVEGHIRLDVPLPAPARLQGRQPDGGHVAKAVAL